MPGLDAPVKLDFDKTIFVAAARTARRRARAPCGAPSRLGDEAEPPPTPALPLISRSGDGRRRRGELGRAEARERRRARRRDALRDSLKRDRSVAGAARGERRAGAGGAAPEGDVTAPTPGRAGGEYGAGAGAKASAGSGGGDGAAADDDARPPPDVAGADACARGWRVAGGGVGGQTARASAKSGRDDHRPIPSPPALSRRLSRRRARTA